jgi:hypothetical protein
MSVSDDGGCRRFRQARPARGDVDGRHSALKRAVRQKVPFFDAPDDEPCEVGYAHVRPRGPLAAAYGVPGHNRARAKLPALSR